MQHMRHLVSCWSIPSAKLFFIALLVVAYPRIPSLAEATPEATNGSVTMVKHHHEIQIFVTSWCPYCQKLEAYLQSRNYKYKRYDVELSEIGRRMHRQLGGGGIPVVVIDKTVIRGFNPQAIEAAMREADTSISM